LDLGQSVRYTQSYYFAHWTLLHDCPVRHLTLMSNLDKCYQQYSRCFKYMALFLYVLANVDQSTMVLCYACLCDTFPERHQASCRPTRLTSQFHAEVSSPMYLYHGAHSLVLPLECGRLRLRRVPALFHLERATEWTLSREHKTLDQLCNPRALNPPSRGAQTIVPAQREA
jgi:hypothetical protein